MLWRTLLITIATRIVPKILINTTRILAVGGGPQAPRLRDPRIGNNAPTVDVFVTTCGEDIATIRATIEGACASDYCRERFRVIVLDDGRSKKLSKLIAYMQCTKQNLFYRSRAESVDHHFKAGNLNDGLCYVQTLPMGVSEFRCSTRCRYDSTS